MISRPLKKRFLSASVLAASVLLSACAIQTDRQGQTLVGMDVAELFGDTVDTFALPDGNEAKLRVLNGQYSIKLPHRMRVIQLDEASSVKFRSVNQINDRTLIVLNRVERDCNFKTQLISLRGSEVLTWSFGDCSSVPQFNSYADAATFDFVYPNKTVRFMYQDARLLRGEFTGPPPGSPPAVARPIPRSAPRYQPGPPGIPTAERPAEAKEGKPISSPTRPSQPPAPRTDTASPRVATPTPVGAMNFPMKEQGPVRIVLDK